MTHSFVAVSCGRGGYFFDKDLPCTWRGRGLAILNHQWIHRRFSALYKPASWMSTVDNYLTAARSPFYTNYDSFSTPMMDEVL